MYRLLSEISHVQVPYNELASKTLVFAFYDFDRMSKDDRLGQVTIPLNTVDLGAQRSEEWRKVEAPVEEEEMVRATKCFSVPRITVHCSFF